MSARRTILAGSTFLWCLACGTAGTQGSVTSPPPGEDEPAALTDPPVPAPQTREQPKEPKATSLPPLCPTAIRGCGDFAEVQRLLDDGEPESALEALSKLKMPSDPALRGVRMALEGRAQLESGTLAYGEGGEGSKKALSLFERALSLAPERDALLLQIARAQLSLGRGDQAISDLIRLAETYAADAEVQAALGIAYLSTGRAARALGPLRRAAELDPQEPERLIVLGTTHMLLGDLTQAERKFRAALALRADSARAHGDLGAVLLVRGQIQPGKAHLQRAVRLAPDRATYVSNLAYAEILAEEPEAAEKWARRALQLDPGLASAWLNLGLAQVALKQRDAARASFEKARKLDPSDPRPVNNLRDLDEMSGSGPD